MTKKQQLKTLRGLLRATNNHSGGLEISIARTQQYFDLVKKIRDLTKRWDFDFTPLKGFKKHGMEWSCRHKKYVLCGPWYNFKTHCKREKSFNSLNGLV